MTFLHQVLHPLYFIEVIVIQLSEITRGAHQKVKSFENYGSSLQVKSARSSSCFEWEVVVVYDIQELRKHFTELTLSFIIQ